MANLKTNYKNFTWSGKKKFRLTNNADGTVSLEDATSYTQVGDSINAGDLNAINSEVNSVNAKVGKNENDISVLMSQPVIVRNQVVPINASNTTNVSINVTPTAVGGYTPVAVVGYSIAVAHWIMVKALLSNGVIGVYIQTRDNAAKTATFNITFGILYVKNELM